MFQQQSEENSCQQKTQTATPNNTTLVLSILTRADHEIDQVYSSTNTATDRSRILSQRAKKGRAAFPSHYSSCHSPEISSLSLLSFPGYKTTPKSK